MMAQIAADNAGVPLKNVSVVSADTSRVPYDAITASSRSTVFMGNALVNACKDLKERLVGVAKEIRKNETDEIVVDNGAVKLVIPLIHIPS